LFTGLEFRRVLFRSLQPVADQPGQGIGHFVGAMRVDGFRPVAEFKANMDQWIARFKGAKRVNEGQPVIIPGEPEYEATRAHQVKGIPLVEAVWADLQQLSEKLGVTPLPLESERIPDNG